MVECLYCKQEVIGSNPVEGSNFLKKSYMEKQVIYKGPGILGLLGIAFVVLKLLGVINWSWWWVTIPFWGPIAFIVILILIAGVILCLNTK